MTHMEHSSLRAHRKLLILLKCKKAELNEKAGRIWNWHKVRTEKHQARPIAQVPEHHRERLLLASLGSILCLDGPNGCWSLNGLFQSTVLLWEGVLTGGEKATSVRDRSPEKAGDIKLGLL